MYLSILALPLFGSATAGLLGRKLGVTGAHIVTTGCLMSSALLALVAFYEVGLCNSPVSIELFSWIDSESLLVQWGFLFDSLTVSMLLPLLVVSSLVHLYSISYMAGDPHNQRFFSYLSMFTFFMLVLVAGDNYLILFVGWEGIGISSFLLINFWYTRIQANKSGIKALTVNRVGDMFLSVGFFAILWVFGNVDYATVFSVAPYINETAITIIGLLLLVGAMAKSAQLGLHTWLPDKQINQAFKRIFSTTRFLSKNPGKNKLPEQPLNLGMFIYHFLIGLIVSGQLILRRHKDMLTRRFQIQITVTGGLDKSWLNYLHELLSSFCYQGWRIKEEVDKRYNPPFISLRRKLLSATMSCLFPLYSLFWLTIGNEGVKTFTKDNLEHFNLISLAAWTMATGYWLSPLKYTSTYGFALPLSNTISDTECVLIQNRLRELGLNTVQILVQDRNRGTKRLVVPHSSMQTFDSLIGHLMIPSKAHLTKIP